jgi:hypothetical protein
VSQLLEHLPTLPRTTRSTHVPNLESGLSYQGPVDFEPLVHEQVVAVVAEHDVIDAVGKSQGAEDGIHKRPVVIGIHKTDGKGSWKQRDIPSVWTKGKPDITQVTIPGVGLLPRAPVSGKTQQHGQRHVGNQDPVSTLAS